MALRESWRLVWPIAAVAMRRIVRLADRSPLRHVAAARDPAEHCDQNEPKRRVSKHLIVPLVPHLNNAQRPARMLRVPVSHDSVALPQQDYAHELRLALISPIARPRQN